MFKDLKDSDMRIELIHKSTIKMLLESTQQVGLAVNCRTLDSTVELRTSPTNICKLLTFLKTHLLIKADTLVDIVAYENIFKNRESSAYRKNSNNNTQASSYCLIYNLLSLTFNSRVNVYIEIFDKCLVHSITSVHASANWVEREIFDMFGIFFIKHPDMRRILCDYGFKGHPMLKDYPLKGYFETYYSDKHGRVCFDRKVDLSYNYRSMFIKNPWMYVGK